MRERPNGIECAWDVHDNTNMGCSGVGSSMHTCIAHGVMMCRQENGSSGGFLDSRA